MFWVSGPLDLAIFAARLRSDQMLSELRGEDASARRAFEDSLNPFNTRGLDMTPEEGRKIYYSGKFCSVQ